MEDVGETFGKLGWFFATVMLGLGIHGLILLPVLYGVMTKSLPFNFTKNMSRALATGTSINHVVKIWVFLTPISP